MMSLRLSLAQTLDISGGCTASVFPRVDAALEATEAQEALIHVACRKDMDRYHSMVDFLFSELFVQFRRACFKFYETGGEQLKDLVDAAKLAWFEEVLLHALTVARKAMEEAREKRWYWSHFRAEVLKAVA
jgi:hypothetical protein